MTQTTATSGPAAAATKRQRPVRVLIVDDSAVIRTLLSSVIGNDPRLEVAAAVDSGEEALRVLRHARPDVVSMDICLPGMNGYETTRRILSQRPVPIVVVAADAEGPGSRMSIEALNAGALTVIRKPSGGSSAAFEHFAGRLCTQLSIMSEVKVITQRGRESVASRCTEAARPIAPPSIAATCGMIGIVASTGGPNALVSIFKALPGELPVPILLVQHMTSSFMYAFTEWLAGTCDHLRVVAAETGQAPQAGCVYVAPSGRHLALRGDRLRLEATAAVSMQCPSGTVLLSSMAESLGASAAGVVLTGMGNDGAAGLLDVRAAGGYTIVEHASTAVVNGMPAAASALGAAMEALPQPMIAPRLCQLACV